MAFILNIETSQKACSIALGQDNEVIFSCETHGEFMHSEKLAPFIEECLNYCRLHDINIDAVAVSMGPGSYTGLRIGLSTAKGLSYGLDIPLIGLSSLKILAVKALFRKYDWLGSEIIIPMMDARRMEVYTGAYSLGLEEIISPCPHILDKSSFKELIQENQVWFIGDGCKKAMDILDCNNTNLNWIGSFYPDAKDMVLLSAKSFENNEFIDPAYCVPIYLKEFQTSVAKNLL